MKRRRPAPIPTPAAEGGDEGLGLWVAERYWPGVTAETLAAALVRVRAGAAQFPAGSTVRHLQSTLVPAEEVVFCLFQASSREAVEDANRAATPHSTM